MVIFLDTEFTNLADREPISIGMVSEDGRHVFYREVANFELDTCSPFARSNVVPLMGRLKDVTVQTAMLPVDVRNWINTLPRSLTISCDSEWDWEVFVKLAGYPLPKNVSRRFVLRPLIDTTVFREAVCRFHAQPNHPWHHALHDAHAHRIGWIVLERCAQTGESCQALDNRLAQFEAGHEAGRTLESRYCAAAVAGGRHRVLPDCCITSATATDESPEHAKPVPIKLAA